MKILAVDDDNIALEILSAALRNTGYTDFVTATSGAQALEVIEAAEQPFDIFLLDIQMPGIDGIELCSRIRRMPYYRTSPILMITAMSERRFIDGAFAAGAMDYINKPFDPIELGVRIGLAGKVLSQRQQIEASQSEVEYLKMRSGISSSRDPSEPLDINEIPRVVGLTAMENYLLRLSKTMAFQSKSIAFAIDGFDMLHAQVSSAEIYDILADTAEAIACGFKRTEHLITHCGNGEFVAICHKSFDVPHSELLIEVQNTLDLFGTCFSNGRPIPLRLTQSKFYIPTLWTTMDSTNLLTKPLKLLAEERLASSMNKKQTLSWPMSITR